MTYWTVEAVSATHLTSNSTMLNQLSYTPSPDIYLIFTLIAVAAGLCQ